MPNANCHEDKGVGHKLANDFVFMCCVGESYQDRVTIHHREKGVRCVAEAVEKVSVVPKDSLSQKDVPNCDR